jgi:hypothetical protein
MKAKYYFEAHITVDAKEPEQWEEFTNIQPYSFKHSKFDVDEVDSYHGKWFMSARNEYLDELKLDMSLAMIKLKNAGYNVIRWKIEDTLFDSKYGDVI